MSASKGLRLREPIEWKEIPGSGGCFVPVKTGVIELDVAHRFFAIYTERGRFHLVGHGRSVYSFYFDTLSEAKARAEQLLLEFGNKLFTIGE